MVRKKRDWFPGSMYHITARGIRRSSLFHGDEDREKFLSLLGEAKVRYPFILHAYCLMTNHIHLQIETVDFPASKIMQILNSRYGRYFNRKYHYSGHVFDKRYGSELVDSQGYELELSKYIHLNPLKANMVVKLEDYRWSSYRTYALIEKSPLVATSRLLSYFPYPQSTNYIHYVKASYTDLSPSEREMSPINEMEERL